MKKSSLVLLAGTVVAMLFVVSSASAVELHSFCNVVEEEVVPLDHRDVKPTGICILSIFAYTSTPMGPRAYPWALLECKDLDTGRTRWALSGFFSGRAIFFGLSLDHTYRITALKTGKQIDVYMDSFWVSEAICVN